MISIEHALWKPSSFVEKWDEDQVEYVRRTTGVAEPSGELLERYAKPYEVIFMPGNMLTLLGSNRLTSLIIGAGGQALTATATRLGVSDSSTTPTVADTDLTSGTNKYYQIMDSTYPQQSNQNMTFKATFATGAANFIWNSWGIDVGTPTVTSSGTVNALLLNKKLHAMGNKVSGSWALTVIISLV